jgi:hypothetical protein
LTDVLEERCGVAFEHLRGRPMNVISGGDQIDLSLAVLLEGEGVAVVAPAVGFDDDLLFRPEEVDAVARD